MFIYCGAYSGDRINEFVREVTKHEVALPEKGLLLNPITEILLRLL